MLYKGIVPNNLIYSLMIKFWLEIWSHLENSGSRVFEKLGTWNGIEFVWKGFIETIQWYSVFWVFFQLVLN